MVRNFQLSKKNKKIVSLSCECLFRMIISCIKIEIICLLYFTLNNAVASVGSNNIIIYV